MSRTIALIVMLSASMPVFADGPPSRYGVDAPELAHLGRYAVGVKTLHLREAAQADVLAFDPVHGSAPLRDRELGVELWYPAQPKPGAVHVVYTASFPSEPPAHPARFSVPGIAVRDAPPAGEGFPLIIVSHGYSGDPVAMTWLTENLASKGYVVAGIRHDDPPITDRSKIVQVVLRRPLDIAYVARTLQRTLACAAPRRCGANCADRFLHGRLRGIDCRRRHPGSQGPAVQDGSRWPASALRARRSHAGHGVGQGAARRGGDFPGRRRARTPRGEPTGFARSRCRCCSSPAITIEPWIIPRVHAHFSTRPSMHLAIC